MRPLARDLVWKTARTCFRISQRTGLWSFHWMGNNLLFVASHGRFPNRENPNIIDLAFLNKFDRENIALGPFVDKELVKHFVAGAAPELRVPGTYAVFRSVEALVGFNLPRPFVAKPTHSSGVVVLKPDGGSLSEREIAKLRWSMGRNYYLAGGEIQYKHLARKILIEEFVGRPPTVAPDFKLQFYEGAFQHCYVLLDRHTDPKPLFIDEEGTRISPQGDVRLLDSDLEFYEGPFQVPDRYQEMIRIGEKLSKPFRFCRVDLFPQDGEIFFGELTFSPGNCLYSYQPESFMALVPPNPRSG